MERTGLERTDRQGVAGTEWRMQVGGERLGRVGIAVAGMEKPVKARGMEGSGTVGIMEARQARCVKVARRKVVQGELRSGRLGAECRELDGIEELRHGMAGMV